MIMSINKKWGSKEFKEEIGKILLNRKSAFELGKKTMPSLT